MDAEAKKGSGCFCYNRTREEWCEEDSVANTVDASVAVFQDVASAVESSLTKTPKNLSVIKSPPMLIKGMQETGKNGR